MFATRGPCQEHPDMNHLIDSHFHVWDSQQLRMPWLEGCPPVLTRPYSIDDYIQASAGEPPERAVYIEINVSPEDRGRELDLALEMVRDGSNPTCAVVPAADPTDAGLEDWILRARESRCVPGFRRVLHADSSPPGLCLQPEFIDGIRLIGDSGMHFELCMRMEELGDCVQLMDAAPGTSFILNHCGNPRLDGSDLAGWRTMISRIAEREHVACKVSGLFQNAPDGLTIQQMREVVEHVRSEFGWQRLLFGSNWPVCNLREGYSGWMEVVGELVSGWSPEEIDAFFHGNTRRLYGLE